MNSLKKKTTILSLLIILSLVQNNCSIVKYSFNGASVSKDCKTASVQRFQNRASQIQPMLATNLTEKFKDKILSQTHLTITNGTADVNIEGTVTNYSTEPVAPQGGTNITSTLTRLTVVIHIKYTNSKEPQYDYEQDFSRFVNYPAEQSLDQVERNELDKIIDQLVQDAFDKAFVNW